MSRQSLEDRLHLAFAVLLAAGAGAAFWVPAIHATGGDWPAPLDDVFIHFDFARSTAELHPFQWIGGQGFSSGETSPLYPFVLAAGYLMGFRGPWLGAWAALVAVVSLVLLLRSVRQIVQPAPWWIGWLGGAILFAIGVVDWTWFSGMETALFGAILGRTLVATKRAREAPPELGTRRRKQWVCGLWGAALVATRPEAAIVIAPIAIAVARRAGAGSAILALVRASLPGATVTLGVMAANRAFTGDAMSAGAILKLLSRNPYLSDIERAKELVLNLVHLFFKVIDAQPMWPLFPALAIVALLARRTRGLSATCLLGALGWALLVSWNGAARYQNFRYYVPALVLVLIASALGLAAMARRRTLRAIGGIATVLALALAVPRIAAQVDHFTRASKNIHDQQVEVGKRLERTASPDAIVLVGDAGAIPYVSRRAAVDALGLGGYHGVPFARAATHGEAAILELIERLSPDARPTHLALYPSWFGGITSAFGREIDRVTINDNVICGGPTKGIYVADWSSLDDEAHVEDNVFDTLDIADVISEEEHRYASPAPRGGWTTMRVARFPGTGRARLFDGGRILPEGTTESFRVIRGGAVPATIVLRTAPGAGDVEAFVYRANGTTSRVGMMLEPADLDAWTTMRATIELGLAAGDTITLRAVRGEYRNYHVWLTR